jgi:hypothetical protein
MSRAYHVGKIDQLFTKRDSLGASDVSVQALLEMWDEGIMVVDVHPSLAEKAATGQFVLVEYDVQGPQIVQNTVTKLLDSKIGDSAWKRMKQFHEKRKKAMAAAQGIESPTGFPDARMVR